MSYKLNLLEFGIDHLKHLFLAGNFLFFLDLHGSHHFIESINISLFNFNQTFIILLIFNLLIENRNTRIQPIFVQLKLIAGFFLFRTH